MARIDSDIVMARPPADTWTVLGDLMAVARWVPGIASVRMEGMRRVCTLEDGGEIHEEISDVSDERRRYSYDQVFHPLALKRSEGTLAVEPHGARGSRVVWNAEIEFADPAQEARIIPMLEQGYAAALQRLKEVLEG